MNTIMLTVRIYNNLQFMKKYFSYFMLIAIVSVFVSCASSKSTTTVLSGTGIRQQQPCYCPTECRLKLSADFWDTPA